MNPSTLIDPQPTDEVNGSAQTAPRTFTPGTAEILSPTWRKYSTAASRFGNCRPLAPSRMEITLSALNPGDTLCRRTKLRISRPAPMRSISESATSDTTSRLRSRRREVLKPPSPARFSLRP